MAVTISVSGDPTVTTPSNSALQCLRNYARPRVANLFRKTLQTKNSVIHSPAVLPSTWVKRINYSDADVVHLHWVQEEMMSISDIGAIKKPIVWTLHDMWAFCGAEHYTFDNRWLTGYSSNNRPKDEDGFDLNQWTWRRKKKYWQKPMHIVATSNWLAECAAQSSLMKTWPVTVAGGCLDTNFWKPIDRNFARELFGIETKGPLVLFGAMGGSTDKRKGFELLLTSLEHLRALVNDIQLLVFGQQTPVDFQKLDFPIHFAGHLHDDHSLRALYSSADVMVVPSRQEAFGQTASEAQACGTPVVAFNNTGLPDIVKHKRTGYLADAFSTIDLANGIHWALGAQSGSRKLGEAARQHIIDNFASEVVAKKYVSVYESAIAGYSRRANNY